MKKLSLKSKLLVTVMSITVFVNSTLTRAECESVIKACDAALASQDKLIENKDRQIGSQDAIIKLQDTRITSLEQDKNNVFKSPWMLFTVGFFAAFLIKK